MLIAAIQQLRGRVGDVTICTRPHQQMMPYTVCCELGLKMKLPPSVGRLPLTGIQHLIPQKLLSTYGLISEHQIDVVFDASGFSYSDQWGSRALEFMAYRVRKWRRSRKKVILLPQALGPFREGKNAELFKQIVSYCDLIYARDSTSYGFCSDVVGESGKIRCAPDITIPIHANNSVRGSGTENPEVLVIPNARIVDKKAVDTKEEYINAMIRIVDEVNRNGCRCGFLIHEGCDDLALAKQVVSRLGRGVPPTSIMVIHDPLEAKSVLGKCRLVIGARYHALVGALSGGVPSLALGWSHKYEELLSSFGLSEGMISVDGLLRGEDVTKIADWLSASRNAELRDRILNGGKILVDQSNAMWDEIAVILDGGVPGA